MRVSNFIIILFIYCLCSACGKPKVESVRELREFLNDTENGLTKVKYVNGIKLSVQYIPEQLLAYLDTRGQRVKSVNKDSLVEAYKYSKSFLLSIGPDDRSIGDKAGDIMYRGLMNYQEYKERSYLMNFQIDNYIDLNTSKEIFKPVLTNLENVYGLSEDRNINVLFAPKNYKEDLINSDTLDFRFTDPVFNTGTLHFVFLKKDIDNIPELNF